MAIHFEKFGTRGRTRAEALEAMGRQLDEYCGHELELVHVQVYNDGTDCDNRYVAKAELHWYQEQQEDEG